VIFVIFNWYDFNFKAIRLKKESAERGLAYARSKNPCVSGEGLVPLFEVFDSVIVEWYSHI
jgi:hypothetical protein